MNIEQKRLVDLIEYTKEVASLNISSICDCSNHGIFCLYEHDAQALPFIRLNQIIGDEEIWVEIPRISETLPPPVEDILLDIWIKQSKKPDILPTIHTSIKAEKLYQVVAYKAESTDKESRLIFYNDFKDKKYVDNLFETYLDNWKAWANEEKKYSKTRELYKKLYFLKQQLDGGISNEQLEIVLGIGIVSWVIDGKKIQYPLITKTVEIILDEKTLAIKIFPKSTLPILEISHFVENDIIGVHDLESAFNKFYKENAHLSPFDSATFEPILRSGVTFLDHSGSYLPDIDNNCNLNRSIPKPKEKLIITDTWVVFARPRTTSVLINDLNQFITKLSESDVVIEGAVGALVTDLSEIAVEQYLPAFRGLSMVDSYSNSNQKALVRELYFPLPFNDEQVRIVQMLEYSNGVVVQGPPGTGKTHTIANVICHYLALGKKVLVTSMREHALLVLQEKIPELIRPLTVSMLSNDRTGMQQFEDSIAKIASEIQIIDRNLFTKEIKNYENEIDRLHSSLKNIEASINQLAQRYMKPIILDNATISPLDAAEEIINSNTDISWIPDPINIEDKYTQKFTNDDIEALRLAKREVGDNIKYIKAPDLRAILQELPKSKDMVKLHNDLVYIAEVRLKIQDGSIPMLANNSHECIKEAYVLLENIKDLIQQRKLILQNHESWMDGFANYLHNSYACDNFDMLETLKLVGIELTALDKRKLAFIKLPVNIPADFAINHNLKEAIVNLSQGKKPFGIKGIIGKQKEKDFLAQVSIASNKPYSMEDWTHVLNYIELQKDIKTICSKWNALAVELNLPMLNLGSTLSEVFQHYQRVDKLYRLIELLYATKATLGNVLPSIMLDLHSSSLDNELLSIKMFLEQHIRESRLSETLTAKQFLEGIIAKLPIPLKDNFHDFILNIIGNPIYNGDDIATNWNNLIQQLECIDGLSQQFSTIQRVTALIEASGAPELAQIMCTTIDSNSILAPEIWKQAWRLKRLHTYLDSIDSLAELRNLFKSRKQSETRLAETYKAIITKRSWLKLTENATPKVKSALQSFVASIRAIGKGTGKRAIIHRTNARMAAQEASSAIPCWIMPHYKISEHLPSALSEFDLVIIDEASQSDLSALPAILRAKKVLVVGDDKQVSPEAVGIDLAKVGLLMKRYLTDQVTTFCPQLSPEKSMYDLFKVVFANSLIMLREHFRCVGAIIEYSKREFYNHELHPLRLPKKSELLEPPLINVWVKDGVRDEARQINKAEARFIVDEIKKITSLETFSNRTIGVVSLLGNEQPRLILEMLEEELSIEKLENHQITCGDAKTFQGKERDIMFISMVVSKDNGTPPHPITRETFSQRFNVAASRARDRMYMVRSLSVDDLSPKDELRRGILEHFTNPYRKDEVRVKNLRELCESPFEVEIYDILTDKGYHVTPQTKVGAFRINLVVEGDSDSRLAIECDGDQYHSYDRWENDIRRQRILERAGWKFWRCFASTFIMKRREVIADLLTTLNELNIYPSNSTKDINRNYVQPVEYIFSESIDLNNNTPCELNQPKFLKDEN